MASIARHHAEWLSLVEVSGPFLSMPVLMRAFPQGLDAHDPETFRDLRLAYEEWQDNVNARRPDPRIHRAWVDFVLRSVLGWDDQALKHGQDIPQTLAVQVKEHNVTLRPDLVVLTPSDLPNPGTPRMLVQVYPPDVGLERAWRSPGSAWSATPATRMMELLHGAGVRVGLVTNGEQWMLVDAPRGQTTGFVSWYAQYWLEEKVTLQAFRALLSVTRFFGVDARDRLEALLAESANDQQEVTDQLGYQVRRAVEVLVQALDRIDRERKGALLKGVTEKQLYEAALTVMMRLVFLLSAEEQGRLFVSSTVWREHYGVATLRDQLREVADRHGEEVLERRHDAWARLLATFRALHGGVTHEAMRSPAYGGGLFDPDRHPFLEGRASGSAWRTTSADPLPIHNRTVLHLLDALQVLEVKVPGGGPAEARRLSFRAIGVEQIGHVYEGLLDHTAVRAREPVLGLKGAKDSEPEVALSELERLRAKGEDALVAWLKDATGRSEKALHREVAYTIADHDRRWNVVCERDEKLYQRVASFAGLVRDDTVGLPVVIHAGSAYVTHGNERRSTGTHYTPPSLTEPIVRHTLEPLVYVGPAEGAPPEQWKLRSPAEILALRVCDMAMGSGAFLVQACRYLAERLVEAWSMRSPDTLRTLPGAEPSQGLASERILPDGIDERLALARRLVADRCLYGVDKNPMAVEMAKLSLWLVTFERERPFTFLDHALRCGDSLLGLTDPDQVKWFHLDAKRGRTLHRQEDVSGGRGLFNFVEQLGPAFEKAAGLRRQLEALPDDDIRDSEAKARLLREAEQAMTLVKVVADLVVASALETAGKGAEKLDERLVLLEMPLANALDPRVPFNERWPLVQELATQASRMMNRGKPVGSEDRRPFHWALEFPEVFEEGEQRGFDTIVGNPPFKFGTIATSELGNDYLRYLQGLMTVWHGKSDLVAGFLRRAPVLLSTAASLSMIATSSLIRGETLESGLKELLHQGWIIYRAATPHPWPGQAGVEIVEISLIKKWGGVVSLDNTNCSYISEDLSAHSEPNEIELPHELVCGLSALMGIKISPANPRVAPSDFHALIKRYPALEVVLRPSLGGEDLYDLTEFESLSMAPRNIDPEALRREAVTRGAAALGPYADASFDRVEHSRPAADLTDRLKTARHVFACGETSVHLAAVHVPTTGVLLRHTSIAFPADHWAVFSILQSTMHIEWAWRFGLRREARLRYSPKRCGRTLAVPDFHSTAHTTLDNIGERYHAHRALILKIRQEGLTKTYNRFHNPDERAEDIATLRALHVEMDRAVADAYGWQDLTLGHGFHATKQGVRYTLSEAARREVLARLLKLNHARYAEEEAAGLHDKKKKPSARARTSDAEPAPATEATGAPREGAKKPRKKKGSSDDGGPQGALF